MQTHLFQPSRCTLQSCAVCLSEAVVGRQPIRLLAVSHPDLLMKFCSECAHPVSLAIPPDDNRLRHMCPQCGTIHYQNPKMVVGSIPVWEDGGDVRILLCKRAIEPRRGFWTLPAGYMENGETTGDAAERETIEEAGARIRLLDLFSLINVPHVHQVHLFYRAELLDLDYAAGVESLEVELFRRQDIPWQTLAFPTIRYTLERYFSDLERVQSGTGTWGMHAEHLSRPMDNGARVKRQE